MGNYFRSAAVAVSPFFIAYNGSQPCARYLPNQQANKREARTGDKGAVIGSCFRRGC